MKQLMNTITGLLIWVLSLNNSLYAQKMLDQYIETGLENNLTLQQEDFKLKQSMEALKEARGLFMPNVSFNASYTLAEGGRTIDVPVGDLLNPVYTSLNQLTGANQFPQIENASEQLLPNDFHDTRIEFRQAIFNTDIYYNYKAKESMISVQQAQLDAYEKELIKEIKKGYYQYLQTLEVLAIYDSSETLLQELLKVNQSLVENSKATKDVVYNAEYELANLYSLIAEAGRQNKLAKSYFNFLLNRELSDSIYVDADIFDIRSKDENVNALQQQAILNRDELRQTQKAIEANEFLYKLNRGKKLPKLSVGGSAGYQGFGYEFDNNQDYQLLQFNLSLPIFSGKQNSARIQHASLEVEKFKTREQELQQKIKVQVIENYQSLLSARTSVIAKQAAAKNAAESFKIIKRKYEEQQVILVEYLDARTKFTNSQINLAISRYDLLIREAELQRVIAL